MSKWILERHMVYANGKEDTHYFVRFGLGLFCELGSKEEAKRFDTKKEAMDMARQMGKQNVMKAVKDI